MSPLDSTMPALLSLTTAIGMACLMVGLWLALRRILAGPVVARQAGLRHATPGPSRWRDLVGGLMQSRSEEARAAQRKMLMQAGLDGPNALFYLALAKLVLALLLALICAVVMTLDWVQLRLSPTRQGVVILLVAVIGFILPSILVRNAADRYIDRIARALPDALDLMLVCVEAGQSLDQALVRVARAMHGIHPDLAERFAATAEALKAGEDRRAAFDRLAWSTDNADLKSFAAVVLQASAMGTPVAETFRVYSADQRDRRYRRVEEQANMLPTKMTLGTMVLTVPPLLLLLLTPAMYRILNSF
ncbi:type II secretion system F family protein [Pseudooceanicola aestuarii]|uniref:type II secretion system F family protein n=1 Tax=Pseudooceanicola aestuarii TaxID=2697319 RepID=UPI0013D56B53|nr:type II secretion system F family protein [Pseudooceanicola aestuarii]